MERPKEIALHMSVTKVLREHCLPEWQWTHIPSGEIRDKRTAGKLKQMGVKAGWPDFVLIPPAGQLHCLELKRQGETLSDVQEAFQLWCIRHNIPHSVAYSLDEALAVLDHWGCLRIKIGGAP
jgi:VRR-NUC domain